MNLAIRCYQEFSKPVQDRGRSYFATRRVQIDQLHDSGAFGTARGSSAYNYPLEVDWSRVGDGVLQVFCGCPYFEGHALGCKHLWAFLLMLDDQKVTASIPGRRDLTLEVVDDDFDGLDDGPGMAGWNSGLSAPATVPGGWQDHLWFLRSSTRREPSKRNGPRQLWLAIDRAAVQESAVLKLDFYCRDRLKSGKLGKLKSVAVGPEDLDQFESGDRELLRSLLALGGSSEGDSFDSYGYPGEPWSEQMRSLILSPLVLDDFLPRLCESGRFGWLNPEGGTLDVPSLRPESLRWVLMAENHEGYLSIEGHYLGRGEKGEHDCGTTASVLVLEPGWLLFRDAILRLKDGPAVFPWLRVFRHQGPLIIPHADVPQALGALLETRDLPELRLPADLGYTSEVEALVPRLTFESQKGMLAGRVDFLYGERVLSPEDPVSGWFGEDGRQITCRDRVAERRRLAELEASEPSISIRGARVQVAVERFAALVGSLQESGWRVEADGRTVRASRGFSSSVKSGIDWFELSGEMDFGEVRVQLPELLAAARRQSRTIELGDGTVGMLSEEWLRHFGPLAQMTPGGKGAENKPNLRFGHHQALLLDALLGASESIDFDEVFERLRRRLRSFSGIGPVPAPETFRGTLRPYQEEGLAWLQWLADLRLGGCLADDMGLGKTIQILAFLEQRRLSGQLGERWALLVVPRSLLHNWLLEGERFTPELPMHLHHGAGRRKRLETLLRDAVPHVLVTTYGTLLRDIGELRTLALDVVVLDEAQAIKNPKSRTAKACRLIQARHRLALTGTPVENHLGELWSLFEFLNPGMLGRLPALADMAGKQRLAEEALETVAQAIRPLVLRRTKDEVLKDLPSKTEQTLACELSKRERKRYGELLHHYHTQLAEKVRTKGLGRSKMMVLEALLRLRQAACHPGLLDSASEGESSAKVEVLLERLREVAREGHKALVFSQFTKLLAIVRRQLDQEGLVYEYLDGRTRKREEKVQRFQDDPACPIFLISLKAGGVGLNLTAASYVFLLDPWWNPAVESQAIDRAHRIGQEQPVFAYRLIARDTVEEKILEMQDSKRNLANAIVAQDRRVLSQMTADDLGLLLGVRLDTQQPPATS